MIGLAALTFPDRERSQIPAAMGITKCSSAHHVRIREGRSNAGVARWAMTRAILRSKLVAPIRHRAIVPEPVEMLRLLFD